MASVYERFVERTCGGKRAYTDAENRIIDAHLKRLRRVTNEKLEIYRCVICHYRHIGHVQNDVCDADRVFIASRQARKAAKKRERGQRVSEHES